MTPSLLRAESVGGTGSDSSTEESLNKLMSDDYLTYLKNWIYNLHFFSKNKNHLAWFKNRLIKNRLALKLKALTSRQALRVRTKIRKVVSI